MVYHLGGCCEDNMDESTRPLMLLREPLGGMAG